MLKALMVFMVLALVSFLWANELVWVGEPGYEKDGVEPEIAYSEGNFLFKIAYVNQDDVLPKEVWVVVDTNRDGFLGDEEKFPMKLTVKPEEEEKEKKYIYEYNLPLSYRSGSKNDFLYFFAARFESQTVTTPLRNGPVLKPRLSFSLSNTFWDTGRNLRPGATITMGPNDRIIINNTGEAAERFILSIEREDIWPEGWRHAAHPDEIGPNKYALSALFTSSNYLLVDEKDFNELGNEDIITTTPKEAVGNIFGIKGYSAGEILLPEQDMALWLQLILPTTSFGKYALEAHDITVKLTCAEVE